jgi:hypothetical protein
MNEKSQVTWERLHSEERKKGRTPGITKEVAGQQKSTMKQGKCNQQFQEGEGKLKMAITR